MMLKRYYKRSFLTIFLQMLWVFPLAAQAAKLAIVIDDIGYKKEDGEIYTLPKAVSVAIIPAAPQATQRALQAHQQQRDILIHLPMQPKFQAIGDAGSVKIGDSVEKIGKLIELSRGQVPYAIGLNNHMGSGATSDAATMRNLMQVLKQNGLFFLDSRTINTTVAAETARRYGVKVLERHVFLDDIDEPHEIRRQLLRAMEIAKKKGTAVVIGHPRRHTIDVLKAHLGGLPKEIELVNIGALWRSQTAEPTTVAEPLFEQEPALSSVPPYETVPLLRGMPR